MSKRRLIVVGGASKSGKSTLLQGLHMRKDVPVVRKLDLVLAAGRASGLEDSASLVRWSDLEAEAFRSLASGNGPPALLLDQHFAVQPCLDGRFALGLPSTEDNDEPYLFAYCAQSMAAIASAFTVDVVLVEASAEVLLARRLAAERAGAPARACSLELIVGEQAAERAMSERFCMEARAHGAEVAYIVCSSDCPPDEAIRLLETRLRLSTAGHERSGPTAPSSPAIESILDAAGYPGYHPEYPPRSRWTDVGPRASADLDGPEVALYIHVPFCQNRCGFCKLYAIPLTAPDQLARLTTAIVKEIEARSELDGRSGPVIFGGGTPTLLPASSFEAVLRSCVQRGFRANGMAVESTPESASPALLATLRDLGLRRLSLGVQSFDSSIVAFMGRPPPQEHLWRAVEAARALDLSINLDLIYGLPFQTRTSVLRSAEEVLALEPDSAFFYPLRVRPGAVWHGVHESAERWTEDYFPLRDRFQAGGWHQNSYLEFRRRPQIETTHDDRSRPVAGVGPGACSYGTSSFVMNGRTATGPEALREDVLGYLAAGGSTGALPHWGCHLDTLDQMRRMAIDGFRHQGLDRAAFRVAFGRAVDEVFGPFFDALRARGLLADNGESLSLPATALHRVEHVTLALQAWPLDGAGAVG